MFEVEVIYDYAIIDDIVLKLSLEELLEVLQFNLGRVASIKLSYADTFIVIEFHPNIYCDDKKTTWYIAYDSTYNFLDILRNSLYFNEDGLPN